MQRILAMRRRSHMLIDTNTTSATGLFRPLPWRDTPTACCAPWMPRHRPGVRLLGRAILYRNPQAGNEELFAETRAHRTKAHSLRGGQPHLHADWEHDLAVCCEEFGIRGLRLCPKCHRYSLGDANGNALIEAATTRGLRDLSAPARRRTIASVRGSSTFPTSPRTRSRRLPGHTPRRSSLR